MQHDRVPARRRKAQADYGFGISRHEHSRIRDLMKADASQSIFGLSLLTVAVVAMWVTGLTPGHPWGDDWAGYLLQAQSLQSGTTLQEVATNTRAMVGGDVLVGPYGYPWGYPIMLAAAGVLADWNLTALKSIGLLCGVLLVWATFTLARFRLRPAIAAAVTALTALQSHVLIGMNYVASDIPFIAVSGIGLVLILRQFGRVQAGVAPSRALQVAVAVVGVVAFSIRSNGALLPCTYVAMLALVVLQGARSASETALHGLAFCALTAALFVLYLLVLPDGSLVQASFLSLDPVVWMRRISDHLNGLWNWFPFPLFPRYLKAIPLALLVALIVRGCLAWPRPAAILAIYCVMHLGLLTVFPFDGGVRYYLPLLAPVFVLMGCGWQAQWDRWHARRSNFPAPVAGRSFVGNMASAFAAPITLAALMIYLTVLERARYATPAQDEPYGAAMQATITWITANAPRDARIGFAKPRAFRLLSGRTAYVISQPQHLPRVDWYVLNPLFEPRLQVEESALRSDATGFRLAFEDGPFKIFVRDARPD